MKTFYQIRFTCYQYNSGGQHNCGQKKRSMTFQTLEVARKTAEFIKELINDKEHPERYTYPIQHGFVTAGYIESFDGIFKITEERVE